MKKSKLIVVIVLLVFIIYSAFLLLTKDFLKIDKCQDNGGAWHYNSRQCIHDFKRHDIAIIDSIKLEKHISDIKISVDGNKNWITYAKNSASNKIQFASIS